MKLLIIFVTLFFVHFVASELTCLSTGITNTTTCNVGDRFCATVTLDRKENWDDIPMIFQGCSEEAKKFYRFGCDSSGETELTRTIGRANFHGKMYCCEKDLCNSAVAHSFYGVFILAFVYVLF
uniref:UPAR/Ly6 domain-containing protein n=1 Tax=Panagrolaimus sp. ES5 TaxID=591445 RepID=A0AC34FAM9_9BILA